MTDNESKNKGALASIDLSGPVDKTLSFESLKHRHRTELSATKSLKKKDKKKKKKKKKTAIKGVSTKSQVVKQQEICLLNIAQTQSQVDLSHNSVPEPLIGAEPSIGKESAAPFTTASIDDLFGNEAPNNQSTLVPTATDTEKLDHRSGKKQKKEGKKKKKKKSKKSTS